MADVAGADEFGGQRREHEIIALGTIRESKTTRHSATTLRLGLSVHRGLLRFFPPPLRPTCALCTWHLAAAWRVYELFLKSTLRRTEGFKLDNRSIWIRLRSFSRAITQLRCCAAEHV